MKSLAPEQLQLPLQTWLQTTENDSKNYLRSLVNDVGSVRTIHGIKTAALELSKWSHRMALDNLYKDNKIFLVLILEPPPDWSYALQRLGLPPTLDFYQLHCQPLVRDRIKEIIKTSWEKTVDKTYAEINGVLDNTEIVWSSRKFLIDKIRAKM